MEMGLLALQGSADLAFLTVFWPFGLSFFQQPFDATKGPSVGVVQRGKRAHLTSHNEYSGLFRNLRIFQFHRRFAAKN